MVENTFSRQDIAILERLINAIDNQTKAIEDLNETLKDENTQN